jgi:hypothetical protein
MNTTTATPNTSILAIDLGNYKSVSCVYDQTTGEVKAHLPAHAETDEYHKRT